MTKVLFDTSMSLDGYMTGPNQTAEEPLGDGGQRLHDWAMGEDERGSELLRSWSSALGAVIAGRRTYDDSVPWWGPDGPTGELRAPVFVLSHDEPAEVPENGVYTFVDGIEPVMDRARAAAGDGNVVVMGGADTGRQFIAAGLVDEIQIHLVPVLFGGGTRMFEDLQAELEQLEVVQSAAATHLLYRVSGR